MIGERKIALAFFDILGTSKRLNENELQKVYEYYECMIKLCSDNTVPIIIENTLYGKSELTRYIGKQRPFVSLQTELKNAFFSDTFILWVELDGPFNTLLGGFFEKCSIVFCIKGKFSFRRTLEIKNARWKRACRNRRWLKEVNIEAFFKFIIAKVVIFS